MQRKLIEAKCPYYKKEYNSFNNWHRGVSSLSGEYSVDEVKQWCETCGEYFILSLTEIRKYSAKKINS